MTAAPSLKVISKHGSGTDTIDKAAAAARGIQVVAAAGANAAAVAEHALALLLACAKSVVALDARMHAGHWDKSTHKSVELAGRTIGLVGLGAIGLRFARMADAMGMHVLGFDPYAREGKRSGAWMNAYRNQERVTGDITTIVSNNANFVKAKPGEPILISWDDAVTMFHEFGHALHGLSWRGQSTAPS